MAFLSGVVGCDDAHVSGEHASDASAAAPTEVLQPRIALAKNSPSLRRVPQGEIEGLVVKFKEGTDVRLRSNGLAHEPKAAAAALPASAGVASRAALQSQVVRANEIVRGQALRLGRTFRQSEAELEALKRRGEQRARRELADLSLYFSVPAESFTSIAQMEEVRDALQALDVVEAAYIQPKPIPAQIAAPPDANTPDFTSLQDYTDPAPLGVDAQYAASIPGGRGEGATCVDIEGGWQTTHEDFPPIAFTSGTYEADWIEHGTAVVGVIAAVDNGFGVTGIAADATVGVASIFGTGGGTASAITTAAAQAGPGGVILIEVHYGGPDTVDCTCNEPQCNYIAVEYHIAEFDAISTATANGVIVVEAAGNGSVDLDHPAYGGYFNRQVRDSGAILVGASVSSGRTPACWTNHGTRVDVHGWGDSVVTLGGGGLYRGTLGEDDEYMSGFSGTSSGSAILAGVATALQGVAIQNLGQALTPGQLRALLTATGTPQSGGLDDLIGPLPDMRVAIDTLLEGAPIPDFAVSCTATGCSFSDLSHDLDGTVAGWAWDFGDGATGTGAAVQHTYAQSGIYTVTLSVTDDDSQTRSISRAIVADVPVVCGDDVCDPSESCGSCADDCGACPSQCTCPSGCDDVVVESAPFSRDGVGETCYFFYTLGSNINSWNAAAVNLNGQNIANQYVPSSTYPATVDGGYYLYYRGDVPWSHVGVSQ